MSPARQLRRTSPLLHQPPLVSRRVSLPTPPLPIIPTHITLRALVTRLALQASTQDSIRAPHPCLTITRWRLAQQLTPLPRLRQLQLQSKRCLGITSTSVALLLKSWRPAQRCCVTRPFAPVSHSRCLVPKSWTTRLPRSLQSPQVSRRERRSNLPLPVTRSRPRRQITTSSRTYASS